MISNFNDVFARFGSPADFARAVGMTVGAAKQMRRRGAIPAEWFSAVARAAAIRTYSDITVERLAALAEGRRLSRPARTARASEEQPGA